jgi:hypothetical protein
MDFKTIYFIAKSNTGHMGAEDPRGRILTYEDDNIDQTGIRSRLVFSAREKFDAAVVTRSARLCRRCFPPTKDKDEDKDEGPANS